MATVRDVDEISTIGVIVNTEKEGTGLYSRQRAWCWWGHWRSNCEVVFQKVTPEGEAEGPVDNEEQSLKDVVMSLELCIESPAPHIHNCKYFIGNPFRFPLIEKANEISANNKDWSCVMAGERWHLILDFDCFHHAIKQLKCQVDVPAIFIITT